MLEKEQAEKKEAESAVNELKRQFSAVKEKCTSVDAEIDQYTDEVNNLRKGMRAIRSRAGLGHESE